MELIVIILALITLAIFIRSDDTPDTVLRPYPRPPDLNPVLSVGYLYSLSVPSGGDLHVEPEELSQTAAWLDDAKQDLIDRRAKIQRDADDVLDGSWRGVPAMKVRTSWDEWVDGYDRVMQALDDSRHLLETARAEYEGQDDSTASSLNATTKSTGLLNMDY